MHLDASSLLGLAQLLAIGLGVYLLALIWHTMRRLTRPPRRTYASAVARGLPGDPSEALDGRPFESWTLKSRGLDLPVWDVKGDDPHGPIVIFLHGWGDGRVGALQRMGPFVPNCSRLLALDLPGNGEAPGTCSLGTREVEDVDEMIERVRDDDHVIVLYGWSMGAGVAIDAASRSDEHFSQITGVIAEAPYRLAPTPAHNVLRNASLPYTFNLRPAMALLSLRFGRGLRWREFDRAGLAAKLVCPLLVIHGVDDEVCPVDDAREIAAMASVATLCEVKQGRHNDLWTNEAHRAQVSEAIDAFMSRVKHGPDTP